MNSINHTFWYYTFFAHKSELYIIRIGIAHDIKFTK